MKSRIVIVRFPPSILRSSSKELFFPPYMKKRSFSTLALATNIISIGLKRDEMEGDEGEGKEGDEAVDIF